MKFNYHTHSRFCDGAGSPEEYVLAALEQGFTHLGFSGHSPLPFENGFAIRRADMENYVAAIRQLQQTYAGKINIYLGLEADYVTGMMEDIRSLKTTYGLDYIIGAVHLVSAAGKEGLWFTDGGKTEIYDEGLQRLFDNDIKTAVKTFYAQTNAMISTQKPDVVGHFDKIKMNNKGRYFSEQDDWYHALVMETLTLLKEKGCVCEINTRGLYKQRYNDYFPGHYLWKTMAAMDIPVMVNSDAHKPAEVGLLIDEALQLLQTEGIREVWYFENGWKSYAL